MSIADYLAKTAKTVDIGGFDWKIRKLTIKEHRHFEATRPADGATDPEWIAFHSQLISTAVIEPALAAEEVESAISLGDLSELSRSIVEHSSPKK
jgi:hypothetical protein